MFDRVKELSDRKGISLTELARKMDWADKAIYNWKNSSPSIDKVEKVADYFNVSTDYLLGRKGADQKQETEFRKALDNVLSFDGEEMTKNDKEAIIAYMMGRKGK